MAKTLTSGRMPGPPLAKVFNIPPTISDFLHLTVSDFISNK